MHMCDRTRYRARERCMRSAHALHMQRKQSYAAYRPHVVIAQEMFRVAAAAACTGLRDAPPHMQRLEHVRMLPQLVPQRQALVAVQAPGVTLLKTWRVALLGAVRLVLPASRARTKTSRRRPLAVRFPPVRLHLARAQEANGGIRARQRALLASNWL